MALTSLCANRQTRSLLVTMAILFATTRAAIATQTVDAVTTAQAIVQGAFPELMSEKYRAVLTIHPPQMRFPWRDSTHLFVRISRQGSAGDSAPEISAEFLMTAAGPHTVSFQGTFVKSDAYWILVRRLESHPEWTEDELAIEAFSAGAEFLPSRVSASALNERVQRLSNALGTIKNHTARFVWRTYGRVGIVWVVDIETVSARCYVMQLEPFTGHQVHLSSRVCGPR